MKKKNRTVLWTIFSCFLLFVGSIPLVFSEDYKTYSELISSYLTLESQYPDFISHEIVGNTVLGENILLFSIGNKSAEKVLIDASIHGNEHASSEILYYTIDWLMLQSESVCTSILENTCILVIPAINIDNYGVSRFNANGVDLNRNYETGWEQSSDSGAYPLSEPETQAIHSVFVNNKPNWYLNLHLGDSRISPPWSYTSGVPEEDYFQSLYEKIYLESQSRGFEAFSYVISGGYAGGTSRDEGYVNGAFTYCVELNSVLVPEYSVIQSEIVPKMIPVLITIAGEAGNLTDSELPQDEPSTVEPFIFGKTTVGSEFRDMTDRIRGTSYISENSGVAKSVTAYVRSWQSGESVYAGIYFRSNGTLLAQSEIRSDGGYGWQTFTFLDAPLIQANTEYVLVVYADSYTRIAYDENNVYRYFEYRGFGQDLPNPFVGTAGFRSFEYSIYCNCETIVEPLPEPEPEPLTQAEWEIFWEWLKQNPLVSTDNWDLGLEEKLAQWRSLQ